jgi:hypothetical protein
MQQLGGKNYDDNLSAYSIIVLDFLKFINAEKRFPLLCCFLSGQPDFFK